MSRRLAAAVLLSLAWVAAARWSPARTEWMAGPHAGSPGAEADAVPSGVVTLHAPEAGMILVPRSTFTMGSTDDDVLGAFVDCQKEPGAQHCDPSLFADETPPHRVTVSAFWLDRTEVTVEAYEGCSAIGRCDTLPYAEGARRFERADFPVSMVTWPEARDYCAFRGARLPTEAEFERAARGVTRRRFPWGNVYDSHVVNHGRLAWTPTDATDGFAELAPVGSFPAGRTPDGFLDLAGNVMEWVQDWYAPAYPDKDEVDPTGPDATAATTARVLRGGSFESAAPWVRGAARMGADPSTRRPSIGFRCAKSARSSDRGATP